MLKRIDPAKLLDTMSKLLAPDGGIKSVELVSESFNWFKLVFIRVSVF